ncbi:tyrosine-type recombinase/integrase [Agriterribacter humi]|uniref:tyrosine-type recombinase/integrase n=1 Tax=Agriterribacter humi TaxID=1104781 RepID=UPI0012656D21|nr:site-specific integrase [Agriterribacter humi]
MATKVKLRQKPISGNRQSLYLDFYPAIPHPETGKLTRREFLNMFLRNETEIEEQKYFDGEGKELKRFIPVLDKKGNPKKIKLNPIEKQHNKETLQLAEQIRQKRENHINKPEIYTGYEKEQLKIKELGERNFIAYFKSLADKRKASNYDNWISAYKYLDAFTNGNLKFADLNEKFCDEFKEYLLTAKSNKSKKVTLSQNSAVSYFNKLKATMKQAYKDGYLKTDINNKVGSIKQAETKRNFLTIEEMNSLVATDCKNPLLKRAAIFSALTGMRFSDIQKLVWGELEYIEGSGYFIQYKQQKTKGVERMPISEQAFSLLGDRKDQNSKVFEGLTYSAYENKHLSKWIGLAGINKDITFHCFRHTYATLQLSYGTDIYTVSKMLGHRELKTTQIYAKIIDQTKRNAADKIRLDF